MGQFSTNLIAYAARPVTEIMYHVLEMVFLFSIWSSLRA